MLSHCNILQAWILLKTQDFRFLSFMGMCEYAENGQQNPEGSDSPVAEVIGPKKQLTKHWAIPENMCTPPIEGFGIPDFFP